MTSWSRSHIVAFWPCSRLHDLVVALHIVASWPCSRIYNLVVALHIPWPYGRAHTLVATGQSLPLAVFTHLLTPWPRTHGFTDHLVAHARLLDRRVSESRASLG